MRDRAALERAIARCVTVREGFGFVLPWRGREGTRGTYTNAFRLANAEADRLPGLSVDVYDRWLVAHLYEDHEASVREVILDVLHALGADGVYVKQRPKQASRLSSEDMRALAPHEPLRGRAAPDDLVLSENGMQFLVNLGDGLSTGIFLDQRDNRQRVRALSSGKSVLNLFAYTCGFSVAAVLGGATRVVSIDVSRQALARGERNLELNGGASDYRSMAVDVFDALKKLTRDREKFDVVIVDPPTYSTTRSSRWSSGVGWARLAEASYRVLAPRGVLVACSNAGRLPSRTFERYLRDAATAARRDVVRVAREKAPSDFPATEGAESPLKTFFVSLS